MAGEDDNDDVIVSLPADTSTVVVTKVETEKEKIKPAPVEDDPVADLKNQFSAMQRQNEVLQTQHQTVTRQLNETQTRLHHVEGEVVTSQLDTVLSGIAAADAEAASAEQALAIAIEAGDAMAQARANRAMAAAEGRKARLEEAKSDLEEVAKRRPRTETREAPQRRAPADPIEQFTQNMSSRSAAWIRAHPDCVTDTKKHARMLAAHNLAIAEDVEVDSDEYFKRIEAGIRPVKTETTETTKKGDGTRPSSAAASAAGAGGGLNGGVQVKLTKGEAASATDGTLVWNYDDPSGQKRFKKGEPIGLAEMARRKHEGMKNGLYDRNAFEA